MQLINPYVNSMVSWAVSLDWMRYSIWQCIRYILMEMINLPGAPFTNMAHGSTKCNIFIHNNGDVFAIAQYYTILDCAIAGKLLLLF